MSRSFYSEINLHVTWHTKESSPLLTPKVEAVVHHYVRGRCISTPGVFVYEVGGTETHVHLCLSVWPTVLISDFIGALKGSSSHEANHKLGEKVLQWQSGYGVVSSVPEIWNGFAITRAIKRSDMPHGKRWSDWSGLPIRRMRATWLQAAEAERREAP